MKLKVTQIRSTINRKEDQKRTIAALGLGRIGRSRLHDDNPVIRGMIYKVTHLVKVEEVDEPVEKTPSKKKVTKSASRKKTTEKKAEVDSPKNVAPKDESVEPAQKKTESKEEKKEPVEKKKPAPAKESDNKASEKATENK